MDELLETLEKIGVPHEECELIRERYNGDADELTRHVLTYIALFDDRHEYLD